MGGGPGGRGGLIMGGGPRGGPNGGRAINGTIIPGGSGTPGADNVGRMSGGGGGGGNRDIPGGKTSGCKVGINEGPGTGGGLGGGGGGTSLETSLIPKELFVSSSPDTPSDRSPFGGIPGGGGGGGRVVGT